MALDFNKEKPAKGRKGIAMKTKRGSMRALISFFILLTVAPAGVFALDQGGAQKFGEDELDQMLAPSSMPPWIR
jgi:hypothetical protein